MATKKTEKIKGAVKLSSEQASIVPQWRLEFEQSSDGVSVKAVSGSDDWYLIKFNNDGTFFRYDAIDGDTGFAVTNDGKLVEEV